MGHSGIGDCIPNGTKAGANQDSVVLMISYRYILPETFGKVRKIFPSDLFLFAQLSKGNAVKDFE
jgi:hypothetical protein